MLLPSVIAVFIRHCLVYLPYLMYLKGDYQTVFLGMAGISCLILFNTDWWRQVHKLLWISTNTLPNLDNLIFSAAAHEGHKFLLNFRICSFCTEFILCFLCWLLVGEWFDLVGLIGLGFGLGLGFGFDWYHITSLLWIIGVQKIQRILHECSCIEFIKQVGEKAKKCKALPSILLLFLKDRVW